MPLPFNHLTEVRAGALGAGRQNLLVEAFVSVPLVTVLLDSF